MDFDSYQALADETAQYPGQNDFQGLTYAILGLCGEAGETAEQVKKTWRDDQNEDGEPIISEERRQKILSELGDTLWYAARVASELDADLSDVAAANIEKLLDRRKRGVISGEGDNR